MSRRTRKQRYEKALAAVNGSVATKPASMTTEQRWKEPPGHGRTVVEHIDTFVAKLSTVSKSYQNPDEAYQQNKHLQRGMLLDPICMEPLFARMMSVALLDWSIKPEDDEDKKQKKECERLERAVRRIPYFTKMKMALLWAIWFGRYGVQIPWVLGWDAKSGGPIMNVCRDPKNQWKPVHGDKFRISWDTGKLGVAIQGGVSKLTSTYADEFRVHYFTDEERQAFLFHTHDIVDGDFFDPKSAGSVMGLGLRHRVWWPWFCKQNLSASVHDYAQRIGTGMTVYYFERDNDADYKAVAEAAKENGTGAILLVPRGPDGHTRGAGVERIEPSTGGAQFLQSLLNDYWCSQIKLMIAGQTLTSETGATGLGSNVAAQHAATKTQMQMYDATNLEETLTRDLLWPMCNYPTSWMHDWMPRFEFSVNETEPEKMMQAARQFFDMGGKVSEDELRETAGLRKPREGEDVLSKAAQDQQGGMGQPGEEPQPLGVAPGADGGPTEGQSDQEYIESLLSGGGLSA